MVTPRTAKRRRQAAISHFQYVQILVKAVFELFSGFGE